MCVPIFELKESSRVQYRTFEYTAAEEKTVVRVNIYILCTILIV